ncbi:MAG: hypothetical protein M3Y27_29965 [Acidobacteriota bacterium]|nr:hypothetical protein [Acidobacteriota bacterium]
MRRRTGPGLRTDDDRSKSHPLSIDFLSDASANAPKDRTARQVRLQNFRELLEVALFTEQFHISELHVTRWIYESEYLVKPRGKPGLLSYSPRVNVPMSDDQNQVGFLAYC